MRIAWIAAALMGALIAANAAQAQQATPPTHSLSEMAPFIGRWDCTVTEASRPTSHMSAVYDWLYDGKALREVITAPGYSGVFTTTYDRRSNSFKGVAVGSDGGAIVWEIRASRTIARARWATSSAPDVWFRSAAPRPRS